MFELSVGDYDHADKWPNGDAEDYNGNCCGGGGHHVNWRDDNISTRQNASEDKKN